MNDYDFMALALKEAERARAEGEVPVGAVLVKDGAVIASAHNRRENDGDATAHAEVLCIREACRKLGGWYLHGCTLYVTLEPCPMCAGAIINARIPKVYYGARDSAMGACGGVLNLFMEDFPHHPALVGGILADDCRKILEEFFRDLRRRNEKNGED